MRPNAETPVKPYKWVLLAAVVVLIDKGKIPSERVYRNGALRSVFAQIFDVLYPKWPLPTRPKVDDPFRALKSEGFWELVPKQDSHERLRSDLASGIWHVLGQVQFARLDENVCLQLLEDPQFRLDVLKRIADTCPPNYRVPNAFAQLRTLLGPERRRWKLRDRPRVDEEAIEELLETGWRRTTFHRVHGIRLADPNSDNIERRQVCTPQNTIDLLGFQPSKSTWWVFELKYQDPSRQAVAQALGYLSWVTNHHATRKQKAVAAILTDQASDKLLVSAAQGGIQVWQYELAALERGVLDFERRA